VVQVQRAAAQTVEVDQHLQLLDPHLLEQAEVVLGGQTWMLVLVAQVAAVLVDLVLARLVLLTQVAAAVVEVLVDQVEEAVRVL
jgi:hypothetical protein